MAILSNEELLREAAQRLRNLPHVAVLNRHEDLWIDTLAELLEYVASWERPLRISQVQVGFLCHVIARSINGEE